MPMSTYKLVGQERTLATNTNVVEAPLVRVVCTAAATGPSTMLHFANNGVEYANMTLAVNTEYIIYKYANATIQGNSMLATAVAYEY